MALYAIGDLHLSFSGDKSMEVFGGRWENYVEKIKTGFSGLREDDVCVLCGDIAWGLSLEEAREDFLFLSRLPGRKIILKGNHDYWWSTASKAYQFFAANGIANIDILNNNSYVYGNYAICGTRGWFYEEERGDAHDKKIMLREIGRLETSLKSAGMRCWMFMKCRCAAMDISTARAVSMRFRACTITRKCGCFRRIISISARGKSLIEQYVLILERQSVIVSSVRIEKIYWR